MTFLTPALTELFENVEQAEDVDFGVVDGIARRDRDGVLRGVMADDLRFELGENPADVFVANVHMDERGAIGDVRAPAAAVFPQRIEHEHVVAFRQVTVDNVGADEPGSAGNENTHRGEALRAAMLGALVCLLCAGINPPFSNCSHAGTCASRYASKFFSNAVAANPCTSSIWVCGSIVLSRMDVRRAEPW